MKPSEPPTEEMRAAVVRVVLDGLAAGRDYVDLRGEVGALHEVGSSFPGEVLLEVAADAFEACRADRDHPIEWEGLREGQLPEWRVTGHSAHEKSLFALWGAVLISAGLRPEESGWWRSDDLWEYAFAAVVIYVRVAAARRGVGQDVICAEIAQRRTIARS